MCRKPADFGRITYINGRDTVKVDAMEVPNYGCLVVYNNWEIL